MTYRCVMHADSFRLLQVFEDTGSTTVLNILLLANPSFTSTNKNVNILAQADPVAEL